MPADFKKLMTARFFFTLAVQMQAVMLGWQMYALTHDPLYLGLVGLVEAIPALGLALHAGYIVDRSNPLFVYKNVVFVSLLSGVVMWATQITEFHLDIQMQVIGLFIASFLTGTARGFSQPAIFSIVPRLIERANLSRSSAWMTTAMQTARISGPALGGVLFAICGAMFSSGVVCATLLFTYAILFFIRTSFDIKKVEAQQKMGEELLSGARFVFRHPILLPALSLDMVSVFFGDAMALLPIYAADILHTGPRGLGVLRAAPAIGAAITSLWLTRVDFRERAGRWLFIAVTGFGITMLMFAWSTDIALSIVALGLGGAFDSVSMVIRTSAVQLVSPDNMRGRISAVNSIFIGSSNELGDFESGVAARLLGTVHAVVFGGVMCLLTVGTVFVISPTLRNLNLLHVKQES